MSVTPKTLLKETKPIIVEAEPSQEAGTGMQISDIYYVLFRHKWKIILCSLLGFAVAVGFFVFRVRLYESEAKLMVRYVLETRSARPIDSDSQVKTPDTSGVALLNTELGMLSSFDLATNVAVAVGPDKILLGEAVKGDPVYEAAAALRKGLNAAVSGNSAVISVSYQHPDPETARSVVAHAVDTYLRMHARIHRGSDRLEELLPKRDQHRAKLEQIEEELRQLKKEVGVISLDDKESFREQLATLRNAIFVTEADLAQALAAAGRPAQPSSEATSAPAPVPAPPADKLAAYRNVLGRLELLNRREQEQSLVYTPESASIRGLRRLIEKVNAEREQLEIETPALTNTTVMSDRPLASSGTPASLASDPIHLIDGLRAKLKTLNEQSERLRADLLKIDEKEARITDLERQRKQEEATYAYYATKLETASLDQAIAPGSMSNISVIQAASPGQRVAGKTKKLVGGALAGGLFAGVGLAFLLEMFMDQSIRRPAHVEQHLRLPLFATIPSLRLRSRENRELKESDESEPVAHNMLPSVSNSASQRNEADATLKLHVDSLRDRLIMHFQHLGLTHKPKLVGVTGCGRGSGVTTVATELAASLSETGEGNVLYVDVNPYTALSIHPFQRGQKLPGIDEILTADMRASGRVQDNLYVAHLGDSPSTGKRAGVIPKEMAGLIPKIKASDYDYIVFDLPPITQTSVTSKVLGLLDMTFFLVESEKTHRDLAKRVIELANGARENMAVVLNKHRQYLPVELDTEL